MGIKKGFDKITTLEKYDGLKNQCIDDNIKYFRQVKLH